MPKARKKAKKSKKIRKAKSRRKPAPAKDDGRQRELLVKVIDKLGASCAIYEDNPDHLLVARFNMPPFVVYWDKGAIEDVPPAGVPVEVTVPTSAAEST